MLHADQDELPWAQVSFFQGAEAKISILTTRQGKP